MVEKMKKRNDGSQTEQADRNIFAELTEGFVALSAERQGKLTLRRHKLEMKPVPVMQAEEVLRVREKLSVSRPVFANYLRVNPRTLEGWEQGRVRPNAQACMLIRLVDRYPDTLARLSAV
jgi:putative transcriptional regulator